MKKRKQKLNKTQIAIFARELRLLLQNTIDIDYKVVNEEQNIKNK